MSVDRRILGVVVAATGLSVALCGTAFAESANQTVHSGPLGVSTSDITLPNTTLNGATQTISGSAGSEWIAKDARGTGEPWSVTISAGGNLTTAAGSVETTDRALSIGNLIFAPGAATSKPGSDSTAGITTGSVTLSTSQQTFISCSATCKGRYGFTPQLTLTVPANAFRSNYSGLVDASPLNPYTVTLTLTIA